MGSVAIIMKAPIAFQVSYSELATGGTGTIHLTLVDADGERVYAQLPAFPTEGVQDVNQLVTDLVGATVQATMESQKPQEEPQPEGEPE